MSGPFDFRVNNDAFRARLNHMSAGAPQAAGRALYAGMQVAFRNSQREVPVKFGILKNSGQLKEPETLGSGAVRVAITYGGAASAYAEIQHENRTLNHPGGGKAGFVIDPVRAAVPMLKSRLQAALTSLGREGQS